MLQLLLSPASQGWFGIDRSKTEEANKLSLLLILV